MAIQNERATPFGRPQSSENLKVARPPLCVLLENLRAEESISASAIKNLRFAEAVAKQGANRWSRPGRSAPFGQRVGWRSDQVAHVGIKPAERTADIVFSNLVCYNCNEFAIRVRAEFQWVRKIPRLLAGDKNPTPGNRPRHRCEKSLQRVLGPSSAVMHVIDHR